MNNLIKALERCHLTWRSLKSIGYSQWDINDR